MVGAREDREAVVNEVRLVGRVGGAPQERELPSGDRLVQLRVVVDRAGGSGGRGGVRRRVDTIDVACWAPRPRRSAAGMRPGDVVEVTGALRRRFFRTGGSTASRYEVEAQSVRRAHRPRLVSGDQTSQSLRQGRSPDGDR